jgi:hypothetical protein
VADADRALFVAGIEAAVVDVYRVLLDRATLPADQRDIVIVLAQHHDEHCLALAAVGQQPRSAVERNEQLYAELNQTVLGDDPMMAIYGVEERLTATHLASLGVLETTDAAAAVASILPIEARHAVVVVPSALPPLESADLAFDEATYG